MAVARAALSHSHGHCYNSEDGHLEKHSTMTRSGRDHSQTAMMRRLQLPIQRSRQPAAATIRHEGRLVQPRVASFKFDPPLVQHGQSGAMTSSLPDPPPTQRPLTGAARPVHDRPFAADCSRLPGAVRQRSLII